MRLRHTGLFAILAALLMQGCSWGSRPDTEPIRNDAMLAALSQVGKPYRSGGAGPDGFDCSGLVQYSYALAGVQLPRSTRDQRKVGETVDFEDARAGDLLFYRFDSWSGVDHVALYLGDGHAIHAPANGRAVVVTDVTSKYWRKNFVEAVDVLD
jgi:cell wall-associated NlpC family hydrolase